MKFKAPVSQQHLAKSLFKAGYKLHLVPTGQLWSAHLIPEGVSQSDSPEVFGGTAHTKKIAIAKALSEFVERNALIEYAELYGPTDSTGFAARPLTSFSPIVKMKTRSTAKLEAIERFFSYYWWEDHSICHTKHKLSGGALHVARSLGLESLKFKEICFLEIPAPGFADVLIAIGYLPSNGFVLGCAAGWVWDRPGTLLRAFSELLRHYQIVTKLRGECVSASNEYSSKLVHLASGALDEALASRLASKGLSELSTPKVAVDTPISHKFEDLYYVHRFVFENQPDILKSFNNIVI